MSRAFTQYNLLLNKLRKHMRKTHVVNSFDEMYKAAVGTRNIEFEQMVKDMRPWGNEQGVRDQLSEWLLDHVQFDGEKAIYDGNAFHIFVPDMEFAHWLVACVKSAPQPDIMLVLDHLLKSKDGKPLKVGVVHFPSNGGKSSAMFMLKRWIQQLPFVKRVAEVTELKPESVNDLAVISGAGNCMFTLGAPDLMDDDKLWLQGIGQDNVWYARLVCGLALYMSAFPETVIQGPPVDLQHVGHYSGNQVTLSITPKVLDQNGTGTHASPVAHYRIGHFRTLLSPRFVNKQFQTIFIKGVFVKNAATVVSPEQVDQPDTAAV